jgi:hypothetical protein
MNKIMIVLVAALSLASFGCKKKGGAGEAMAKMEDFKNKMCACKEHDTKCAQGVTDEMTKWSQEMAKNAGDKKPDDVSPEDAKKMADITKAMGDCSMKAMTPDMSGAGGGGSGGGTMAGSGDSGGSGGGAGSGGGSAPAGSGDGSAAAGSGSGK